MLTRCVFKAMVESIAAYRLEPVPWCHRYVCKLAHLVEEWSWLCWALSGLKIYPLPNSLSEISQSPLVVWFASVDFVLLDTWLESNQGVKHHLVHYYGLLLNFHCRQGHGWTVTSAQCYWWSHITMNCGVASIRMTKSCLFHLVDTLDWFVCFSVQHAIYIHTHTHIYIYIYNLTKWNEKFCVGANINIANKIINYNTK